MSRTPSIDGEVIVDSDMPYDEAKHFITITTKEYYELIHDSEFLRCLVANGVKDTEVWKYTDSTFYPDNINEDDWRKDQ